MVSAAHGSVLPFSATIHRGDDTFASRHRPLPLAKWVAYAPGQEQPMRDTPVTRVAQPLTLPSRTRRERLDNWLALLALLAGSILLGGW
jgi:hypothetical protein